LQELIAFCLLHSPFRHWLPAL